MAVRREHDSDGRGDRGRDGHDRDPGGPHGQTCCNVQTAVIVQFGGLRCRRLHVEDAVDVVAAVHERVTDPQRGSAQTNTPGSTGPLSGVISKNRNTDPGELTPRRADAL
jgi:hypothetical protein